MANAGLEHTRSILISLFLASAREKKPSREINKPYKKKKNKIYIINIFKSFMYLANAY